MKKILVLNGDESKSAKTDLMLKQYASSIIEKCKDEDKQCMKDLLVAMYLENMVGLRGVLNNLDNLDTISGCTYTSKYLKEMVEKTKKDYNK